MFAQRILRAGSRSWMPAARRSFAAAATPALTTQQKQIVKATIPALEQHGIAITTLFYKRLLQDHPELRNIFNTAHQATGEQPAALAHAVWAYASNIDNPGALKEAVSRIGHKHASLGVTAEQYPIVGQGLLAAIKDVLGSAATPEILEAWAAAYQQLADIFVQFESDLYRQAKATPGGWKGWRKFFVSAKVPESDEIISFHLTPEDRDALPAYQPVSLSVSGASSPSWARTSPDSTACRMFPTESTFRSPSSGSSPRMTGQRAACPTSCTSLCR